MYLSGNTTTDLRSFLCTVADNWHLQQLQWTTEPPTQAGWYWAKTKVDSMQCVEVIHQSDNKHIFVFITDVEGSVDLDYFTHWLGPLPVPESPTKGE